MGHSSKTTDVRDAGGSADEDPGAGGQGPFWAVLPLRMAGEMTRVNCGNSADVGQRHVAPRQGGKDVWAPPGFDRGVAVPAPGQVAAVLGPNGAGKSTLLGILSTLVPPSAGSVTWGDQRLGRTSRLRSRIGYVGHDPGVYGDLTASENLRLFARLLRRGGRQPPPSRSMLARVGLGTLRPDAPARTFSRGMQQRLALARALLAEPDLLLFDEPGSALDPAGAAWLTTVVADRARRRPHRDPRDARPGRGGGGGRAPGGPAARADRLRRQPPRLRRRPGAGAVPGAQP